MFYTHGRYIGESYYSILCDEYINKNKEESRYERKLYHGHMVPDSSLGAIPKKETANLDLMYDERPYFWEYDGITLREMTREDYIKNHEIVYDTEASVFFDSDVKLPQLDDELSDFENAHLNFGGEDDRIEFAILTFSSVDVRIMVALRLLPVWSRLLITSRIFTLMNATSTISVQRAFSMRNSSITSRRLSLTAISGQFPREL